MVCITVFLPQVFQLNLYIHFSTCSFPVNQVHCLHHIYLRPWDLFRSFKVCSDAKERVGCGRRKVVKLQHWFPSWRPAFGRTASLGSCACSEGPALGQNTLMMMMMIRQTLNYHGRLARWRKWRSCDVGEAKEGLENELWRRWSNGKVGEWAVT